jgi:hypothetical protein
MLGAIRSSRCASVAVYNRSRETFPTRDGTVARFCCGVSEIGLTVHIQLICPLLSKHQTPPPRLQISIRQWSLLAGIANTNVTAAVIITPNRTPIRNVRLILVECRGDWSSTATARPADFAVPLRSCTLLPLLHECFSYIALYKGSKLATKPVLCSSYCWTQFRCASAKRAALVEFPTA